MEVLNLKYLPKSEYFFGLSHFYRIKYTEEKKCINRIILLGIGYEAWLICDNEDALKKFVATQICSIWL